jgi:hypothetical protein
MSYGCYTGGSAGSPNGVAGALNCTDAGNQVGSPITAGGNNGTGYGSGGSNGNNVGIGAKDGQPGAILIEF